MTHDSLPLRWGKLADVALSGDQLVCVVLLKVQYSLTLRLFIVHFRRSVLDILTSIQIGASFSQTNATVWCVDLKVQYMYTLIHLVLNAVS